MRVARLAKSLSAAVTLSAITTLCFVSADNSRVHAAGPLTLVTQDFNVAADGTLWFVVEFPDDLPPAGLPNATLVVTAYRPVDTRVEVADALEGTLPRSADTVDLPLALLARPTANSVQGVVQLESVTRTPERLQLSAPGLYPVTLEVRDGGEVVAELLTFVHRLPDAGEGDVNNDLRVAFAMRTTSPVRLDDRGDVIIDDTLLTELTHLADILDAVEATEIPLTISVPPALLEALSEASGHVDLGDRLRSALSNHDVLSAPRLPLDASQAADAGEQALYTEWLRDGDDMIVGAISRPSVRTITFVSEPVDQGGAALHRDLGSRLFVITEELLSQLPDAPSISDTSKLLSVEVAEGVRMDATIPDARASIALASESNDPVLNAITTVADLLAARQEIVDDDDAASRRGFTLATPDLSLPPTATIAAIARLVAETPGLHAATLDELSVRTDRLTDNGDLVVVSLPATVAGSLADRLAPVADIEDEAAATASMLPEADARRAAWAKAFEQLPTSALTDAQVAKILDDLQAEFAAIRSAVELPQGFSFTLTGRTTVPIKLHNTSDVPLTVLVRMKSTKLLFPEGDKIVTLPPQAFFDVEITIEVRSNGRFPVTLEVFTPTGGERIARPVTLTARVSALKGLANFVTGALILVLIAWWAHNMRKKYRRRAALKSSLNHPVRGADQPTSSEDAVVATTNLPDL